MARVGEPCPVCRKQMGPGTNSRQMTCGSECGIVYKARRTEERRHERYAKALAAVTVGGQAPPPTYPHGPVAELTRPSAWADEPVAPTEPKRSFFVGSGAGPQGVGTIVPEEGTVSQTFTHGSPSCAPAERTRRIFLWPDTHLPYGDPKAISLALNLLAEFKPDILVMLGDVIDCTGFSRFPRAVTDPKTYLATELEEWHSLARSLADAAPNAEKVYIRGNHEARIEKWLWGQPQLTGHDGFSLGSLLKLSEHGFRPDAVEELEFCEGHLTIKHGTYIGGNFAGAAARQELTRAGTSGVSGHTHRAAKYIFRDKAGLRMWIEAGHLALNPQHYSPCVQNWAQAVVVGEIETDGNGFDLDVIPFRLSYKARLHGKELAA